MWLNFIRARERWFLLPTIPKLLRFRLMSQVFQLIHVCILYVLDVPNMIFSYIFCETLRRPHHKWLSKRLGTLTSSQISWFINIFPFEIEINYDIMGTCPLFWKQSHPKTALQCIPCLKISVPSTDACVKCCAGYNTTTPPNYSRILHETWNTTKPPNINVVFPWWFHISPSPSVGNPTINLRFGLVWISPIRLLGKVSGIGFTTLHFGEYCYNDLDAHITHKSIY